MHISVTQFIDSPAQYLEKISIEPVFITQDGQDIAVLAKPSKTPIADSLLGILKNADVKSVSDIKDMRLGLWRPLLTVPIDDMEDALQAWCAKKINADALITRDTDDFPNIEIPVVAPANFSA